jgi:predicted dehydrogenase
MYDVSGDRLTVREREGEPREIVLPALPLLDRAGCLAEFAAAVRTGRQPESSGRDNLPTLALCLAAIESATRGVPAAVLG